MVLEGELRQILRLFDDKGWSLYYRGNDEEELSAGERIKKGPASSLEIGSKYTILPKVSNPHDLNLIRATIDKYKIVPCIYASTDGVGRRIIQFPSGEYEEMINPEEKLDALVGFQLLEYEIYLFLPNAVFMPYKVFIKSLDSLNDISSLELLQSYDSVLDPNVGKKVVFRMLSQDAKQKVGITKLEGTLVKGLGGYGVHGKKGHTILIPGLPGELQIENKTYNLSTLVR